MRNDYWKQRCPRSIRNGRTLEIHRQRRDTGYYRREYEKLDDFDYTGLTNIAANNIYLGAIPENCTAQLFGVFF